MKLLNEIKKDWKGFLINVIFSAMVLLMIFDSQKPPAISAFVTGMLLIALSFSGAYKQRTTAMVVLFAGTLWIVLGVQRILQ